MKILMITQWFDPEPSFKGQLFAKKLGELGAQVEVITGFPNYPGGKLYPGYKLRPYRREVVDSVVIHRVFLYPSHSNSKIGRVLNYITFMFSAILAGLFCVRRPDIIYAYHPPLTTAISSVIVSKLRRLPLVCDIQDLWPDTLEATEMISSKFVLKKTDEFCRFVYRNSNKIVVLSEGFQKELVSRNVPKGKIEVIHNWTFENSEEKLDIDEKSKSVIAKWVQPFDHKVKFLFAGTMGKAQNLENVIKAAAILESNCQAHFFFMGGGIDLDELKSLVKSLNLSNVNFIPRVPIESVKHIVHEMDILIVHLKKDALFEITIPSKIQAYLNFGKPILGVLEGDAANLIINSNSGLIVEPSSVEKLVEMVKVYCNVSEEDLVELGGNGKRFYDKHLSLNIGAKKFYDLFVTVIKMEEGKRTEVFEM